MSKIKIKSHLHNVSTGEVYNTEGIAIKNNNKIMYNDDDVNVVIYVNESAIIVERSCKEYQLTLQLSNKNITKGIYDITGVGEITLQIETKRLKVEKSEIETDYIIDFGGGERTKFEFLLKMEELK